MEAGRSYLLGGQRIDAGPLAPGLHIVATPIGNMADITIRALSTLAAADLVLCEDTRLSARLMERYGIRVRLSPYHEHNARKVRPGILERLKDGAAIALISDAGMPLVSDPGYRLVKEAAEMGIAVTACPGPSAPVTALALSGLPTDRFLFAGFIPQKQGERRRLFAELADLRASLVFFESPHRIIEALADLEAAMPGRPVALCRELTKLHEEVLRGEPAEVAATLAERQAVKGEITLVVGPPQAEAAVDPACLDAAIAEALAAMPASRAASEIARRFGLNRAEVYARIVAARDSDRDNDEA